MTWSSVVLATSPYLWWRIGEASGTSGADASGNSRLATYASITLGQTSLVPSDLTDTAGLVNNVNDQVSNSAAVSFSSIDFSAMMVIKEASVVTGGIFASGTQNYLNVGGTNFQAIIDSTGIALAYPVASVFDGNPHLVILIVKATSVELWVDGVMVASASHSKTGTTRTAFQLKRGSAGPAAGTYDELALWTRGLSSTEIGDIYNAYLGFQTLSVTGTIDLATSLEGNAVSVKPVTGVLDLATSLEGNAVSVKPVTGVLDLGLSLEGNVVPVRIVSGTLDLGLVLEGSATNLEIHEVTGTIDLGLTLEGNAERVMAASNAWAGERRLVAVAIDGHTFQKVYLGENLLIDS